MFNYPTAVNCFFFILIIISSKNVNGFHWVKKIFSAKGSFFFIDPMFFHPHIL